MIKIIYDVDDVLNNLNQYVMGSLNLPLASRFNINKCQEYSDEQKMTIYKTYSNPDTFRKLTYDKDIVHIFDIERTGKARVKIVSRNYNAEIARVKLNSLMGIIPNLDLSKVDMQIGLGDEKKIDKSANIIVEDCIENAIKYPKSTIKIIINRTHNNPYIYNLDEASLNIIRVDTLGQAIDVIRRIVNGRK